MTTKPIYKLSNKFVLIQVTDIETLNQMLDDILNDDISVENFTKLVRCVDSIQDVTNQNLRKCAAKYSKTWFSFGNFTWNDAVQKHVHNCDNEKFFTPLLINNNIMYDYDMNDISNTPHALNDIFLAYLLKKDIKISTDVELANQLKICYDILSNDFIKTLIEFGIMEEVNMKNKIFTPEFLKEINFTLIEEKKSEYKPYAIYGKAKDKIGMTIIEWNEEGHSCTYFGEKLEPNTSIGILKDAGTRTAFNGYVYTQDDVRKILSLTW